MSEIPQTQVAFQFVGADETRLNTEKPVPELGPTQILCQIEATGICFSDTKLLHAFAAHPRKSEVLTFLSADELAEIPGYVPGDTPTVPGHEACARVVAVGSEVKHHQVGDRALVQTDYRHMLTAASNASFGYNFEGALQQYTVMDERVIIDPRTQERFLIPVSEEPSASAVGLLEPWACVERAYATEERATLRSGGKLLVVAESGHIIEGLTELIENSAPGSITAVVADSAQEAAMEAVGTAFTETIDGLEAGAYDDIIYFGADPDRVEALQPLLGLKGVIDIVLGGKTLGRPVNVDVGRVHYDLTRWVGTPGTSAAEGYDWVPATGELRSGEKVGVIGAAGPMGFMHVIRALTAGLPGVSVDAVDIDNERLAHLTSVAAPMAEARGLGYAAIDSKQQQPAGGYTRIGCMVPVPPLAASTVELADEGGIIDFFAGFAVGTTAPLDLDTMLRKHIYILGTSGSMISDMKAVLGRLEAGTLDTNISVYAVSGMQGVDDALGAVMARTSGGKIVIYPQLTEMGMVTLAELPERLPQVAEALDEGRWTKAAEEVLLEFRRGRGVMNATSEDTRAAFADERQAEIARLVEDRGRARVTELADAFGVSSVTVRKDLDVLAEQGRIIRTHGGAIAPRVRGQDLAHDVRDRMQQSEKAAIGRLAASRVNDGESIIVDASTTCLYLARELMQRTPGQSLTIVTNSIRLATELSVRPDIGVLLMGGRVRGRSLSLVGQLGDGVLRRVNVQKAFVGAAGFTVEEGLTETTEEEAQIKRAMVAAAREVYALVDNSKWGRVASATFCRPEDLTGVFTDAGAPGEMLEGLQGMGIEVHQHG